MNAFITWHPNFIQTFPIDLRRNPSVMSRPTQTADISRKQPTFYESSRHFATPPLVFPGRWRMRKECRNSILMTCRYLDLGYPFWLVEENFPRCTTNQEHHSDLGSDTSKGMLSGWFSNRTGTSVDYGVRKPNNWLDQWQSDNLGTGSRIECFLRAFCARCSDVNSRRNQ